MSNNLKQLRALCQVLEFNEGFPDLHPDKDIILAVDKQGKILIVNQAIKEIFGWEQDEILGKSIKLLIPDNVADKHDEYIPNFADNINAGKTCIGRVIKGKTKSGELINCYLSINQAQSLKDSIVIGIIHPLEK